MQDAHDSSTSCRPSHRTFSGCSCSPRSASPTSESAPPAPTSSSRLCARARTRGCTLRHALPARKRLRPLSPHADLPSRSTHIAPTKSGVASRRLLPLHCGRFVRPHTCNMQHSTRNTQHATRNTQHATRNMQHSTCQHATCNTQHATCNMQHATLNTPHATRSARSQISKGAAPVSAAALPQVGLPARWLPVHVCRWEWSACDERSSRLIIVVYSPSAAPARSCSSGTQRSQRPVLGADFAMRMPRGTGAMEDSSRSPHRCSASKVAPT